jgi:phosphatidylserine decarboxylase
MNSKISNIITKKLIKKYNINQQEYEKQKFTSYNDFFTRKKKEKYLNIDKNKNHLISPADSKLTVYDIKENSMFKIKDSYYSINELLNGDSISEQYKNGKILIFRLEPTDYHRYCYIDDGTKNGNKYIKGIFHTVKNIALKKYNIYKKNAREYTTLDTKNFGKVIQIEVGALIVGRIKNHHKEHQYKKGEEKGYFEFNGSTIALIFKKNKIEIDQDIKENSKNHIETIVKYGEKIGTKKGIFK